MIEDALDIARLANRKFRIIRKTFNVRTALQEVCDIVKFQTDEKDLAFFVIVLETVPSDIYSDEKRFKQVLFNLIGNAAKYTFSGLISVELSYNQITKHLSVVVEDTGVGIIPENLSLLLRFFGKLSKTKEDSSSNAVGLGLGLTLSKKIV